MVPPDQKALTRRCPILYKRRADHEPSSSHYRDDHDEIDNEGEAMLVVEIMTSIPECLTITSREALIHL